MLNSYVNTFILSACVFQGLLLAFLLMKKQWKAKSNIILSVFILMLTSHVVLRQLNNSWLMGVMGPFYSAFYYLPYLYGPFTYLYLTKTFSEQNNFKSKDLLHFIPFCFSVSIAIVTYYGIIDIFSYINNDVYNITDTFIQLIVLSIYIILSNRKLKKLQNNSDSQTAEKFSKWFFQFSTLIWITGFLMIVGLTFIYYNIHSANMKLIFFMIPLVIYWISYKVLTQPELFSSGHLALSAPETNLNFIKYRNTGLNQDETEFILTRLNIFLEKEKPYLDPEISVEKLAAMLDTPKHHLSQVINQRLNKNFYEFINEKRVLEAKNLLLDTNKQHYTIAAIAYQSGFNSISSFNEVFKKYTSQTPSEFRKKQ